MASIRNASFRLLSQPISSLYRSPRHFSTARCLLSQDLSFPLTDDAFEKLKETMKARKLPLLYEYPISTPIAQLESSLRDFLPDIYPQKERRFGSAGRPLPTVPFSYHLIFFPPQTSLSELLPDSTDPAHSPGNPFDRRMWAGGSIERFGAAGAFGLQAEQDSSASERDVCLERISDVQLKGTGDSQKIFVTLERRVGPVAANASSNPDSVRNTILQDDNCTVIEKRNLVFMNNSKMPKPGSQPSKPPKVVKAAHPADYSVSFVPTAALLFRFSALTFNAHRIHLDREYCRDVEGHRNLIVHGPLSCMLMCELVRSHLEKDGSSDVVSSLEYRNLAPVYCDEEMKICLRKKESGDYEVWVENAQGSLCVKGTAKTSPQ